MPRDGKPFQLGFEHELLVGLTPIDTDDWIIGSPVGANFKTVNNIQFVRATIVRDVTVGGSNNTVDVSTRADLRSGYTAQANVSRTGETTAQIRWEASNDKDLADINAVFKILEKAVDSKEPVCMVDLDHQVSLTAGLLVDQADTDNVGARGLFANYSIASAEQKPVGGVVQIDITASIVGLAGKYVFSGDAYTAGAPGVTPPADGFIATQAAGGFRPLREIP